MLCSWCHHAALCSAGLHTAGAPRCSALNGSLDLPACCTANVSCSAVLQGHCLVIDLGVTVGVSGGLASSAQRQLSCGSCRPDPGARPPQACAACPCHCLCLPAGKVPALAAA